MTPILIAALQDPRPLMRPFAARALGHLCDPAALPALDRLVDGERDELSEAAAKAAVQIRYELAWQEFDRAVDYLHYGDWQEQKRALQALSTWDDPRSMDLILDMLSRAMDPEQLLTFAHAAKIVANLGEARALPLLAAATEFWTTKNLPGMVEDAEEAADYIRRKLNGEELEPYVSITDKEDYELDGLDETDNDSIYGTL